MLIENCVWVQMRKYEVCVEGRKSKVIEKLGMRVFSHAWRMLWCFV